MALLCALVVCLGGTFTLEQPHGSFLEFYPRWRWFLQQLVEHGGPNSVKRLVNTR